MRRMMLLASVAVFAAALRNPTAKSSHIRPSRSCRSSGRHRSGRSRRPAGPTGPVGQQGYALSGPPGDGFPGSPRPAGQCRTIRAFDNSTGRILSEYQLPAGGYATPSVYTINGKQYVVIAAGGAAKPETRPGDAIIAFALPD